MSFLHPPAKAQIEPPPAPPNIPLTQFEVTPTGPLNLGDRYEIKAIVTLENTTPCQNCRIQWHFLEDPQPGDELTPRITTTNSRGETIVSAVVYAVPETGYRQLYAKITLPDGTVRTSNMVQLQYHNNPILGFVRLVTDLVKKGYVLPPFGNVYPKAIEQKYTGGQTREIFLEWNRPFGARRFDIFIAEGNLVKEYNGFQHERGIIIDSAGEPVKQRLVKSVPDTKTSIETDALKDVQIFVDACTTGDSCTNGWTSPIVPKILHPTQTGIMPIPNFGIEDWQKFEKMQQEEEGFLSRFLGPLVDWFKGIYNLF